MGEGVAEKERDPVAAADTARGRTPDERRLEVRLKDQERRRQPDEDPNPKRFHYRRLLNADDLRARGIGYSRAHLHRLILAGRFPAPIKLGENRNAWIASEVDAWIESRIAARDAMAAS